MRHDFTRCSCPKLSGGKAMENKNAPHAERRWHANPT